ncbi:hypothetical protein TIFTF001_027547 [Ficus carica]|uniref:Retrotransposon gag domain-containing protein n=1 Tax=Ficus carica TaxID=3494 RepID=A0AA88DN66_FICCA|nr:hypothetical protein TIFTF001_027547 [Ficus carica]
MSGACLAHLVGGQLPNGHTGDDLVDPANPNDLPNRENQREGVEETRETGGDNNHPLPVRLVQSNLRGSSQRRAKRRAQAQAAVGENRHPMKGEENRGRPPRPHRLPMRDKYFDNAFSTGQFPHLEGDLRDHLKACRRGVLNEESRRVVQEARQMIEWYGYRLGVLENAMHIEHESKPKHTHPFTQECRVWNTLVGAARRWSKWLPTNSISCWDDLRKAFQSQFTRICKLPKPRETLVVMHQEPNESLKDWLHWYTTEVASMKDLTEREALIGALSSMRHDILFREDLNWKSAYSYQEFLERSKAFIKAEETRKLTHNEASHVNNLPNNNSNQSFGRQNNKRGRDNNNDNADNAARRRQNHSLNPLEDLTSMLSL